jgi:peptide/nickel transport system permease protein
MKFLIYLIRRAIFIFPQLIGIVAITFIVVRMVPGDPARLMGGPYLPKAGLEVIRQKMGLTGSLPEQFMAYITNLARGNLGESWYTGNPVWVDIQARLPATLQLIFLSLLITFVVMLPIASRAAMPGRGRLKKVSGKLLIGYGMAAGAFPDFWLGLIMIYVFYAVLGWVPPPVGQLDIALSAPQHITGMYLVDSLLTANWEVFYSNITHSILPVFVLSFVYGGAILKVAIVETNQVKNSQFINFAKVCGLPQFQIKNYINKAVRPPVATISAIIFGFLIGGAVLVEKVFSWGGFGEYAVQAVVNADFAAIQGVVLVSAVLNLLLYIVVDIIYFIVDPRIKRLG